MGKTEKRVTVERVWSDCCAQEGRAQEEAGHEGVAFTATERAFVRAD